MVAAFNSTTGSREARESLSEANKGYRECTEVSLIVDCEEVSVCSPDPHFVILFALCSTCAHWRAN